MIQCEARLWLDSIADSTDMKLSKFWRVENREACRAAVHEVTESDMIQQPKNKKTPKISMCNTWFQTGKGVHQGCILSPCSFNLHAKHIMRNAGLEEAQAGIRITSRNTNNLRYAGDTTLIAESEELKSLLMKVKEESQKAGSKLNIQKTKIMASSPITSWQIVGKQWKH